MGEDSEFMRAQARKCRWLAERVNARDVIETLQQMARDYDARADGLEGGGPPPSEPPSG